MESFEEALRGFFMPTVQIMSEQAHHEDVKEHH